MSGKRQIKITITVNDDETLENYQDVVPELIEADFLNHPQSWFKNIEIDVKKEGFEK